MKLLCFLLLLSVSFVAPGQREGDDMDSFSVPSKLIRGKTYTITLDGIDSLDSAKVFLVRGDGIVSEFSDFRLNQTTLEVKIPAATKAGSACRLEILKKDGKVLISNKFEVKRSVAFSQVTFWPKLGVNASQTTYDSKFNPYYYYKVKTSTPVKYGFFAGLAMDVSLSRHFSIRPELIFSQLNISWGENIDYGYPSSYSSDERKEIRRYLTLPINLVGVYRIGPGKFQVTLGPYISLGLRGQYQATFTQVSLSGLYVTTYTGKLIAGKVPSNYFQQVPYHYNPLDIGINFGLGYQLNRILISGQFGAGFSNTQPHFAASYLESSRKDLITRNRSVSLGVAYRIGKIKKLN